MGRFLRGALVSSVVVVAVSPLAAQTGDPHVAQPERPSVATHALTVAPGWLEVEMGLEHDRENGRSAGSTAPFTAKIGLSSRLQLSLLGSLEQTAPETASLPDVTIGVKWRLADHVPVAGKVAILPNVTVPIDSASQRAVGIIAIASQELGPVAIDANVGYTRTSAEESRSASHETFWAVAAGGPLAGRLGWVAELFGYPRVRAPDARDAIIATLFGPSFEIRPSIILDAGVIARLAGPRPHALYAGGVWNAGRLWRAPR